MIVSAISPANASGELNLGLGLLYNMMWIPTGAGKTKIPFYICVYVKTIGI